MWLVGPWHNYGWEEACRWGVCWYHWKELELLPSLLGEKSTAKCSTRPFFNRDRTHKSRLMRGRCKKYLIPSAFPNGAPPTSSDKPKPGKQVKSSAKFSRTNITTRHERQVPCGIFLGSHQTRVWHKAVLCGVRTQIDPHTKKVQK